MRTEFDLTMSDHELEMQGWIFERQKLRGLMTFEQFIIARISCTRRIACNPHRLRLDRIEPIFINRRGVKAPWFRFGRKTV